MHVILVRTPQTLTTQASAPYSHANRPFHPHCRPLSAGLFHVARNGDMVHQPPTAIATLQNKMLTRPSRRKLSKATGWGTSTRANVPPPLLYTPAIPSPLVCTPVFNPTTGTWHVRVTYARSTFAVHGVSHAHVGRPLASHPDLTPAQLHCMQETDISDRAPTLLVVRVSRNLVFHHPQSRIAFLSGRVSGFSLQVRM